MPPRVRELTGGEGVPLVIDTVGKDTFEGSLASLKRRGMLVCARHGVGADPADRRAPARHQGSLYVTRPALADYHRRSGRAGGAGRRAVRPCRLSGRIRIEINQRYALEEAVQAHRDLEARRTTGSSIFIV